jgi:hypothetical protein
LSSDRRLDRGVDVAGRKAHARGAGAIDVDLNGRLPQRSEHREIGDALYGAQHAFDLVGGIGQRLQIVAEQLDRVLAFDAGDRLGNVVLEILREIELDAGEGGLQLFQHFRGQLVLVHTRGLRRGSQRRGNSH